jgi:hypothetical protein
VCVCELRKRYRVRDMFVCLVSKRYVCSHREIGGRETVCEKERVREKKEKDMEKENERERERL